ncbi:hypothetical protein GCM10010103_68570 [Streptomyces paradoxus]
MALSFRVALARWPSMVSRMFMAVSWSSDGEAGAGVVGVRCDAEVEDEGGEDGDGGASSVQAVTASSKAVGTARARPERVVGVTAPSRGRQSGRVSA